MDTTQSSWPAARRVAHRPALADLIPNSPPKPCLHVARVSRLRLCFRTKRYAAAKASIEAAARRDPFGFEVCPCGNTLETFQRPLWEETDEAHALRRRLALDGPREARRLAYPSRGASGRAGVGRMFTLLPHVI